MAPKRKPADGDLDSTNQVGQQESQRLVQAAVAKGVISNHAPSTVAALPPSKLLLKSDGKDIIKKSTIRKNRYMLVFNFQLAPAAAGKLGTLAALDTKNPVMYIDFPTGRLKLFGTLVFPQNKYMVLRLGQGSSVLCEDVLENMVVFSDTWWVGRKEDNPEEKRLEMPAELVGTQVHETFDFAYGAAAPPEGVSIRQKAAKPAAEGAAAAPADGLAVADGTEPETQPPSQPERQMARRAATKRRYAEDSDAEASEDDEGSQHKSLEVDEEDEVPASLPKRKRPSAAASQPATQPASQPPSQPASARQDQQAGPSQTGPSQPPADASQQAANGSQPPASGGARKAAARGKPGAAAKAAAAHPKGAGRLSDAIELLDDSQDMASPVIAATQRSRPGRAAAAKRTYAEPDDDEEDEPEAKEGDAEEGSDAEEAPAPKKRSRLAKPSSQPAARSPGKPKASAPAAGRKTPASGGKAKLRAAAEDDVIVLSSDSEAAPPKASKPGGAAKSSDKKQRPARASEPQPGASQPGPSQAPPASKRTPTRAASTAATKRIQASIKDMWASKAGGVNGTGEAAADDDIKPVAKRSKGPSGTKVRSHKKAVSASNEDSGEDDDLGAGDDERDSDYEA